MSKPLSKLLCAYENEMGLVCDRKRCTRQAARIVSVHFIDHCHKHPDNIYSIPKPAGTGDRVYLMCEPCGSDVVNRVAERINQLKEVLRHSNPGAKLTCKGCGRPLRCAPDGVRVHYLNGRVNA